MSIVVTCCCVFCLEGCSGSQTTRKIWTTVLLEMDLYKQLLIWRFANFYHFRLGTHWSTTLTLTVTSCTDCSAMQPSIWAATMSRLVWQGTCENIRLCGFCPPVVSVAPVVWKPDFIDRSHPRRLAVPALLCLAFLVAMKILQPRVYISLQYFSTISFSIQSRLIRL